LPTAPVTAREPKGSARRARQRTARWRSTAADQEARKRPGSHPVALEPTGRVPALEPTGRARAPPTGRVPAPPRGRVPAQAPGWVQGRGPTGPGRAQGPGREPTGRVPAQGQAPAQTVRAPGASATGPRPGPAAGPGAGRARLGQCSEEERSREQRLQPGAAPDSFGARRPLSVIDRPKCASPARTSRGQDFLHVGYPPCRGSHIDPARDGQIFSQFANFLRRYLRNSRAGLTQMLRPSARSGRARFSPKAVPRSPGICSCRAGARRARRGPAAARAGPAAGPSGGSRRGRMSRTRAARGGPGFRSRGGRS
jgi:hypothetical protein